MLLNMMVECYSHHKIKPTLFSFVRQTKALFIDGESPEFSGKVIVGLAQGTVYCMCYA